MNQPKYVMNRPCPPEGGFCGLNSHPSFPFCKRVSHFESDLQILYPTFHFCNDFPVFFLAFMI